MNDFLAKHYQVFIDKPTQKNYELLKCLVKVIGTRTSNPKKNTKIFITSQAFDQIALSIIVYEIIPNY